MAYKKEINPWLKANGYTWEDMNKFWEECCEVNWKCRMIRDSGKSWNDMHMSQIELLPTLKESTLKQLAEREEKKKQELEAAERAKADKDYYENHFEELMIKKIDSKEPLTERELDRLTEYSISRDFGEKLRWNQPVYDIIELCGRYFSLTWYQGNTEMQENDYTEQPEEVFKTKRLTISYCDVYTKTGAEQVVIDDEAKGIVKSLVDRGLL